MDACYRKVSVSLHPVKVKSEKPGHLPVSLRLNDVRTQIFLCTGDSVPETTGITTF